MKKIISLLIGLALLLSMSAANAALPTTVTTALTGFSTDLTTLFDTYIWPLFILVLSTFFIMKLVKKSTSAV